MRKTQQQPVLLADTIRFAPFVIRFPRNAVTGRPGARGPAWEMDHELPAPDHEPLSNRERPGHRTTDPGLLPSDVDCLR